MPAMLHGDDGKFSGTKQGGELATDKNQIHTDKDQEIVHE
jgi:hypothetical protein